MDTSLEHRLFDPPPKQHANHGSAAHKQQCHYSCLGNVKQHHHNSTSVNGNLPDLPLVKSYQNEPTPEMRSARSTQSSTYVEILKNTAYQNLHNDGQGQKSLEIAGKKTSASEQTSSSSCKNKSYSDFLTITPRRKEKLLSTPAAIASNNHYQQSIGPLNLLSVQNEMNCIIKSTKTYDYRTFKSLSNAHTLLLGATVCPKLNKFYCTDASNASSNGNNFGCGCKNINNTPSIFEFKKISDKSLSPPSAFSDGGDQYSKS